MLTFVGITLLILAVTSSLCRFQIFNIPPVLLEVAGISFFCLLFGLQGNILSFLIILCGFFLAMFLDPFTWKFQRRLQGWEDPVPSHRYSFVLNGTIGLIGTIFFFAGYLLSHIPLLRLQ